MTQIAFLLLCHRDPEGVIGQVRALTAGGDRVVIHHDANAPAADHARLRDALAGDPGVAFVPRRLRCGWGEWSLVEATLAAARTALAAFPDASHLYLISGACLPIKSAAHVHAALAADPADHVETVDFFTSGWIKTGLREERLIYRHPFNERRRPGLFYAAMAVQKRLGLARPLPAGLRIRIGSQWWCLRRATVERLLAFLAGRADVVRFFRRTWIPDETFFQTLVHHLVPEAEIRSRCPTFALFSDYGMPVVFHDDQIDFLLAEDRFFARKISPEATALKARLTGLWASGETARETSDRGARLHRYITGRGRIGLRFAPRAWQRESSLGVGRELLLILSKKWHVGRRLADRIAAATGVPALGYVFHEEAAGLPDLGGIERTLAKRARHRRALLRLLFDRLGTDRLAICIDPHALDAVRDFLGDAAEIRLLEVEHRHDAAFLDGHARRIGLIGAATPEATAAEVRATLDLELRAEAERLRGLGLPGYHRIREAAGLVENSVPLARFLGMPTAKAVEILTAEDLFAD